MNYKTKQTLAVILSAGGAFGTLLTVALTRKAAMREAEMRMHPDQGNLNLMKPIEQAKILVPVYIPSLVSGALTITSIIGSTVMSNKAQASLMSMAVLADQGWRKYKDQVKKTLGLEANDQILSNMAKDALDRYPVASGASNMQDGTELYFEEHVGFFKATPENIALAYANLNEVLTTDSCLSFKDAEGVVHRFNGLMTLGAFLKICKAEILDSKIAESGVLNGWGWTREYLSDSFDNIWVHIRIVTDTTKDGAVPVKELIFNEDAIYLQPEDFYDNGRELSLEGLDIIDDREIIFSDLRKKNKKGPLNDATK